MINTSSVSFTFLLSALLLTFSACVEVAPDRGVVYGSPDRAERTGVREVLVTAQILDQTGRPLPDVSVSAETKRGIDSGITNSRGELLLQCDVAGYERVDFFFEHKGSIRSYSLESMPQGLDAFKAVFKFTKRDGVQLISTEH